MKKNQKDYWPIDGTQHHDIDRDNLFRNKEIDEFFDKDSTRILIAAKGMGKTLLLRNKKKLLESMESGAVIIPENEEYDRPVLQGTISVYGFEQIDLWENLWTSAIIFSILSYNGESFDDDSFNGLLDFLNDLKIDSNFKQILIVSIVDNVKNRPSYYINELLKRNLTTLHQFFRSLHSLKEISSKYIRNENIVFIDAFDQTLTDHFSNNLEVWRNAQLGLVKATHLINIDNRHIKVYASIRQEAYAGFSDDDTEVIRGNALMLEYKDYELKELFRKTIELYTDFTDFKSFFRMDKIHYKWCDEEEGLFDYMLRHSTFTPRSIVHLGKAIDGIGFQYLDEESTEREVRSIVNNVGADGLYNDYLLGQKRIFLNTLLEEPSIKKLLSLIPANVLSSKSLKAINNRFSEIMKQPASVTHPFCELYNIGLLGTIKRTGYPVQEVQRFRKPYEFDWNLNNIIREDSIYLIHPSLQDAIVNERGNYYLNPHNIIGEGKQWLRPKNGNDNIFPLLFISHSSSDKKFVERAIESFEQEINLRIPCDIWYDKWSIIHGQKIHQEAEKGVENSDFVIVFVSKESLGSGWVDGEWRTKHEQEITEKKIRVIAVIIEDTHPKELPKFLNGKKALIANEYAELNEMIRILCESIATYIIEENKQLWM